MTGTLEFENHIQRISPCFIGLLNGSQTIANSEGTLKLGPRLTIHNVLYVLNLNYNLISISQLLQYNPKYEVYFFKSF